MLPVSSSWDAAVRSSHTVYLRVDAYRAGELVASDLPVDPTDGVLTVDGMSPIRRSVELTIADPALVPISATDLLTPHETELHIRRGFSYPNGTIDSVMLGVFRIDRPSTRLMSGVRVSGVDRAKLVQDDVFLSATTTDGAPSATHVNQIIRVIRESVGYNAPIDPSAAWPLDGHLAQVTWEEGTNKLEAIEELALAIDCEVKVDASGTFTIAPIPKITDTPVWTIDIGSTGVLVDALEEWPRDEIFNAVVVKSEPADGSTPVRQVAYDTNPNSPTYWYGTFGHRPRMYSSPLIKTAVQAAQVAKTLLARGTANARTITVECIPNPALEDGDVVYLTLPAVGGGTRGTTRHMVRGYRMPLGLGAMTLDLYTPEPVL